jgi:hypothetical protein
LGNKTTSCDLSLISRFHDNELFGEELEHTKRHIQDCPYCQKALHDMERISGHVKKYIERKSPLTEDRSVEYYVLGEIQKYNSPWWIRLKDFFFSKKIMIPIAAMAAFTLIFVTLIQPSFNGGPSAIVSSVSGEVSSIVILETPDTHQTILWFNENTERQSL